MAVNLEITFNSWTDCTDEKSVSMKSIQDEFGNIPFKVEDNKIYLFSDDTFTVSTREKNSENEFIFRFLEGIPNYNLGINESDKLPTELLKKLHNLFEEIQLDVNCTDTTSGESDWIDVQVTSDGEFEYEIEEGDDDDDW